MELLIIFCVYLVIDIKIQVFNKLSEIFLAFFITYVPAEKMRNQVFEKDSQIDK